METSTSVNSAQNYTCNFCDIKCSKKNDWERHIITAKHKRKSGNEIEMKILPKDYTCKCGKVYETNSGLWKHVKNCKEKKNEVIYEDKQYSIIKENPDIVELLINENKEFKNVIIELLKNNSDLQTKMFDVCKNSNSNNNNTINTINSHNKTFNLQLFLNEQCKDAMNIMDFVNTFNCNYLILKGLAK